MGLSQWQTRGYLTPAGYVAIGLYTKCVCVCGVPIKLENQLGNTILIDKLETQNVHIDVTHVHVAHVTYQSYESRLWLREPPSYFSLDTHFILGRLWNMDSVIVAQLLWRKSWGLKATEEKGSLIIRPLKLVILFAWFTMVSEMVLSATHWQQIWIHSDACTLGMRHWGDQFCKTLKRWDDGCRWSFWWWGLRQCYRLHNWHWVILMHAHPPGTRH